MDAHNVAVAALAHPSSHGPESAARRNHAIADGAAGSRVESDNNNEATMDNEVIMGNSQGSTDEGPYEPTSSLSQKTNHTISTPPTSEGPSSQGQESHFDQLSQLSQLAAAQRPLSPRRSDESLPSTEATYAGQKRTADGFIANHKSASPPASKKSHIGNGKHSRNLSTTSSVTSKSTIGELGAVLRTKLSYAMVKVNHGWQDMPLAEVESMTSQAGSPTSGSTVNGRRALASPRAAIASRQRRAAVDPYYAAPSSSAPVTSFAYTSNRLREAGQQVSTYESFWKAHSASTQPTAFTPQPAVSNTPLAPPVDIRPIPPNPRRSADSRFTKLLGLPTQTSNTNQPPRLEIPQSSAETAPHTPGRASVSGSSSAVPNSTQTSLPDSSQKSLQERDAIETLIFMSSPGNSSKASHTFPPPPPRFASSQPNPHPQSPLKTSFAPPAPRTPGRKVEFTGIGSISSSETSGSITPRKKPARPSDVGNGKKRDDAMDRMLDAMKEDSSDSEDVDIEIPTTPRRAAASRAT